MSTSLSKRSYKTPNYKPVKRNIYRILNPIKGQKKYRVRMSINNVKYDEYFTKRKDAVEYLKELKLTRQLNMAA